jgi:hypothetical protein
MSIEIMNSVAEWFLKYGTMGGILAYCLKFSHGIFCDMLETQVVFSSKPLHMEQLL